MLLRLSSISILSVFAFACSDSFSDTPSTTTPRFRIHDVIFPDSPSRAAPGANVRISGTTVLAVDTFDETHNGKAKGTIYVQDGDTHAPYSGIMLYAPSFVPSNLKLAAGDTLDLAGQYVEQASVGTVEFKYGPLPQIATPVVHFAGESQLIAPTEIDPNDLNSYDRCRPWLGMLVTVKNVKVGTPHGDKGRVSAFFTEDTSNTAAVVTNELFDLGAENIERGTTFSSITGVVTFFISCHLAPRASSDLVK